MTLQISAEYERAYRDLLRLGLIRPDEDVHAGDADCYAEACVVGGRYRLFLEGSDDQYEDCFTVRVRSLDTGEDVLCVRSPVKDPRTDEVREPWSVWIADSVRAGRYEHVRNCFGDVNGSVLLRGGELSEIVSAEDLVNPLSKVMFGLVLKIFAWFRSLS